MNEEENSVDDPVEDAALLSECEIKRDSVCVLCLSPRVMV